LIGDEFSPVNARIQQWIYAIRGSYWFIPMLLAIAAIIASQLTVELDRQVEATSLTDWWWVQLNQPEGARALLATVAGSMITVTGVTFSMTILAVSYATSHFGPRLLDNFMHDRGNQITLGTFVATFLYCLLVLRTVRSSGEGSNIEYDSDLFVPHISIMFAMLLTLASVGILIYFIHHIPDSINISNVLHDISQQLDSLIDKMYPEIVGPPDEAPPPLKELDPDQCETIRSTQIGYLQGIDQEGLMAFTADRDGVVQLLVEPGEHILPGQPMAWVKRGNGRAAKENQKDAKDSQAVPFSEKLSGAFAVGIARTPTQDVQLLLNQLVEVAVRALSPGVNDPFTAIQCIDHLARAMARFSLRSLPSRFRADSDGTTRIITKELTWEMIVNRSLVRLIPYVRGDVYVSDHFRHALQKVRTVSHNAELNHQLQRAESLLEQARSSRDRD